MRLLFRYQTNVASLIPESVESREGVAILYSLRGSFRDLNFTVDQFVDQFLRVSVGLVWT